jgi:thermitase
VLKRLAALAAILLAVLVGPPPAEPARPGLAPGEFRPGEVLVKFRPGRAPAALGELGPGIQGAEELPRLGLHRLRVPPGQEQDFIERLRRRPDVEYAQPNYVYRALFTPNDPYFGSQWNLPAIHAPEAWDITRGTAAIKVAVVDTGVDCGHPDLQGQCAAQVNYVDSNSGPIQDDNGHGTHVAGIIAAVMNNRIGVAGVAPGVKLVALKALDSSGSGDTTTVAQAIDAALTYGARVINLSLGGPNDDPTLRDAINRAYAAGALTVAAAGNSGTSTPVYPAAYDHVIAVAAVDGSLQRASFSNYGSYIALAAPGVGILSTYPGGSYAYLRGTSMAAPHVSAAAALVLSLRPDLGPDAVASILFQTADDLGTPGWDPYFGYGLVNAYRAVRAVAPAPPPVPAGPFRLYFPLVASTRPC